MSWGTLQGARIVRGMVMIPTYGAWVADLVLATADPLPTLVSLTLGTLSMAGAIYRTGADTGARSVRVVGGFGGWRTVIGPQDYDHPGALLASLVLGDAAQAAGEQVALAQDFIIGDKYVRIAAPAKRVLDHFTDPVAGPLWWIRPDGVTVVGPHPAGAITSEFDVTELARGKGMFTVATETETDWLPGRSFQAPILDAPQTISAVSYTISPDGPVRLQVLV